MITTVPQSLSTFPVAVMSKTSLAMMPLAPIPEMAGGLFSAFAGAVSVRGGAQAAFDLTRARIRLEGLSAYGVITALLMNAALRLLSSTPKKMKDVEEGGTKARIENVATVLFAAAAAVCILSAAYTTTVFSMLALYSKTALGMGEDEQYMAFFQATEVFRKRGFNSFILSLLCFKSSVVLNLFLNYKGRVRWAVAAASAVISLATWSNLSEIMQLATNLLFS